MESRSIDPQDDQIEVDVTYYGIRFRGTLAIVLAVGAMLTLGLAWIFLNT